MLCLVCLVVPRPDGRIPLTDTRTCIHSIQVLHFLSKSINSLLGTLLVYVGGMNLSTIDRIAFVSNLYLDGHKVLADIVARYYSRAFGV